MRETCSLCNNPAGYILVYGCLNLHIHNTITCQQHMIKLVGILEREKQNQADGTHLHCNNCDEIIDEYLTSPIPDKTTPPIAEQQVKTGMITIQEAINNLNLMLPNPPPETRKPKKC
jgi:hypothetical protein